MLTMGAEQQKTYQCDDWTKGYVVRLTFVVSYDNLESRLLRSVLGDCHWRILQSKVRQDLIVSEIDLRSRAGGHGGRVGRFAGVLQRKRMRLDRR
jgi:hypothetical protein